jgi:phosphoenolpyruvate carboxylase
MAVSIRIPRSMSTQHPDNVRAPFFADSVILGGEDEIKEAFYAIAESSSGTSREKRLTIMS